MVDFPSGDKLRRQVEDIREVGTLPHVMMRILEVVSDENSSAEDLAREVAADASLTAKILKIVNSAFYGFYREIALLNDAVVVLGFEEIKRISIAISVVGMFGGGSTRDKERLRFWNHCFHTAALAELVERELGRGRQGAFTAGLLHDIGRAVLDQHFPPLHQALLAEERASGRTPADVELDRLGVTHAEIGYWLADRWNLPPTLADAIRFHHAPGDAGEGARLAATVHIADALAHQTDDLADDRAPAREIAPVALGILDVTPSQLQELQLEFTRRMADGTMLVSELMAV